MIVDIRYRDFNETGEIRDQASFLEFVKLYINHRPVHGISVDALKSAYNTFKEEEEIDEPLTREAFIEGMCEIGEAFTKPKLSKCLSVLLHFDGNQDYKQEFFFLPEEIDFDFFLNDMLGIDMNRTNVEEAKVSKNQADEDII
ncbi:cilia- and flagella-associated protein 251-like [Agrilus planipennis]|nr:cilia- and flagella-associated protein 251-like [Agrilus planipennis]